MSRGFAAWLIGTAVWVGPCSTAPLASQAPEDGWRGVWRWAELYRNPDHPVVQDLRLRGRFHYEYATASDDEDTLREWNVRRARLGFDARLFGWMGLRAEADFNPQEADPFYKRLTQVYLEWQGRGGTAVRVGKLTANFTSDGSTSSNDLLAVDRGALTYNLYFTQRYFPGINVSGARARWSYLLGVYSSGAANREFGRFSGTAFMQGTVGYDLADRLDAAEALVGVNYVYQDPHPENTFTRPFRHAGSTNVRFARRRWGFRADVSAADGYGGQPDLWGTMLMPFVNVTEQLQLLGRLTLVESRGPNGLRLPLYEELLVGGLGDRYRELYLGVSYYFNGHKLKVQSGVQFGEMEDDPGDGGAYSGVAATTGLRVSW